MPASALPAGPVEYLIAGLGNPGREYDGTRHNAGFLAVERIARQCGVSIDRIKFKSLYAQTVFAGHRVLLLKPQTFMNLSGEAVRDAAAFYKLPMERVVVLYDDVSLPPGKIRVRPRGSAGGHNGIKNIIYLTGTDVFPRVKIGVGEKPRPEYDLAAWVLGHPAPDDAAKIDDALGRAVEAAEAILTLGTYEAMNRYN